MEWVEFTARTLEEAKDLALDRLGVAADDAEFEVLAEPKPGLFGRLRGEARVRARVRPAQARQKVDRRERRPRKSEGGDAAPRAAKPRNPAAPKSPAKPRQRAAATDAVVDDAAPESISQEAAQPTAPAAREYNAVNARQVGDEARKFIDELVAAFTFTGTTELIEDGDDLEVRVHGENLGLLVGHVVPRCRRCRILPGSHRSVASAITTPACASTSVDIASGARKRSTGSRCRWPMRSSSPASLACSSRCRRPIARSSTTH